MSLEFRWAGAMTVVFFLWGSPLLLGQGPGSCGLRLDVLAEADGTSTCASMGGLSGAPGGGATPLVPGAPGNPYTAYATPGSTVLVRLSVPGGALGPTPFGPGSKITLGWSLAAPPTPFVAAPPLVSPCQPGQDIIVQVLPLGGLIVDGVGLFSVPPIVPPVDPGYPATWDLPVVYPFLPPPVPPLMLQAVIDTPSGVAISNAVGILPGPSPHEVSLKPSLVSCGGGGGGFAHLTDGTASVPTPPGFPFYGTPAPIARVHVDGFVDFLPPGSPAPCDPTGEPGDFADSGGLGCFGVTPEARPRIDVNHFDATMTSWPGVSVTPDLTREMVPASGGLPARLILRWKEVRDVYNISGAAVHQRASAVCELWGDGRVVICRQSLVTHVTTTAYGQMGIGPGLVGQGFSTMPPTMCWGVAFPVLYGMGPLVAGPGEPVSQAAGIATGFEFLQGNLAVVFDPVLGVPGAYSVTVW